MKVVKKRYCDKYGETTPKDYEKLTDRHIKVLKIFSKYRFNRILDVGCGDGNFSVLLKEACSAKEVYGIEISEKSVRAARKMGVKAFQLDIDEEDFPFEEGYFDAIFAGEIIEHLFDPDHLLDEIYRTLNEKGILVITTPNLASLYNRIALLLGFQPYYYNVSPRKSLGHLFEFDEHIDSSWSHIRMFTLRSLKELLKYHKFEILKVYGCSYGAPPNFVLSAIFKSINKILDIFPSLSVGLITVSRKVI